MGARASRQIKRDNCLLTQVKRGVAAPARPLTRLAGPGRRQKINLKRVLSPPDLPWHHPRQTRIADCLSWQPPAIDHENGSTRHDPLRWTARVPCGAGGRLPGGGRRSSGRGRTRIDHESRTSARRPDGSCAGAGTGARTAAAAWAARWPRGPRATHGVM
jgi:hypothetical protein